jgi:rhodanese-related sulfurtransferase
MPYPEVAAKEAFDSLDRYRVIDVREDYEIRGPLGCIDCAEHVPLSTVKDHAEELNGAHPLLLVCRSGKRSGKACEILEELGREDVANLTGGMIAWNRAGLPVLHAEPESLSALVDQLVSWTAMVGPLTEEAAREDFNERLKGVEVSFESPTHSAVEDLISFVAEELVSINPPDLELSLASFRRSLAVL